MDDSIVFDQGSQGVFAGIGARSQGAVVGRLLRQLASELRFEMALRQVAVEVALVLGDAPAEAALDGERSSHARSWSFDEVVAGRDVGVGARVGLGLS